MLQGFGTLIYTNNPYKLIVSIDNELGNYYRSLIPKHIHYQKPMYDTHISVIRNEKISSLNHWGEFNNCEVEFNYDNFIFDDCIYFWLAVECNLLKNIRIDLGLQDTSQITRSPSGIHNFHITIANSKF